jgi:sulfite exporter TauE/SafE
MLSSLMLTALLMGLGGVPHCAAMCGSACAVVFPRGVPILSLLGRCLSYALLGAVAAASAGLASAWGRQFSFLQPLWVMGQGGAVLLGLWLLFTGRVPQIVETVGQEIFRRARARLKPVEDAHAQGAQQGGVMQALAPWGLPLVGGMAWALLPCGLLYAAVMTAALAPSPLGGAIVMLCFALPGAVGVWAAPAVLARLRGRWQGGSLTGSAALTPVPVIWLRAAAVPAGMVSPETGAPQPHGGTCKVPQEVDLAPPKPSTADVRWAVRLSGAMLATMAAWGAYHLVMAQWRAWCA